MSLAIKLLKVRSCHQNTVAVVRILILILGSARLVGNPGNCVLLVNWC